MPVIPSFGKFAATPDFSGAYLGGAKLSQDAASDAARIQVQRENIAADAAASAARIQLGREQIAAESVQNQMQLEAKKQIVAQQAMKQAQEAEIEKSYRETQLGMAERELKNDEAITNMRLQEAARGFEASQTFNRVYQQRVDAGDSKEAAQREAARAAGPEMSGFAAGISGGGSEKTGNATERSLMYRNMADEEKRIMARYGKVRNPNFTPEDRAALDNLARKRAELFPMEPPTNSATNTTSAALSAPRWQVDPATLPYGAPKNPSIYMGDLPPPQFGQVLPEVPMMPTNQPSRSRTNRVGRFNIISNLH